MQALKFNIASEFNIQCYIYYVIAALGWDFLKNPMHAKNANVILQEPQIDEDTKIAKFYEYCKKINGALEDVHSA